MDPCQGPDAAECRGSRISPRSCPTEPAALRAGNVSSMRSSVFRAVGYRTRRAVQRSPTTCRKRADHIHGAGYRQLLFWSETGRATTAPSGRQPSSTPSLLRLSRRRGRRRGVDTALGRNHIRSGSQNRTAGPSSSPTPTADSRQIDSCLRPEKTIDAAGRRRKFFRLSRSARAPVAQLDRAPDYESGGQEFESLRARH